MKLISLNIFKGCKLKEIIEWLKLENPDLVALQEVMSLPGTGDNFIVINGETLNSLEILQTKLCDYQIYFSPELKTNIGGRQVLYGNAFLSKLHIRKKKTHFIYEKYADNFNPPMGVPFDNEPKCLQKINVTLNEKNISIINLHGLWQIGNYKGDSEKVTEMIKNIISQYNKNEPTIICGDFNLTPNTQAILKISNYLTNLTTKLNKFSTKTILSKTQEVIDYVFVNKQIKVVGFEIPEIVISDHKPQILTFQ